MALQKIIRYKRAFDLAQIESNLEEEEKIIRREQLRMANSNELRDNMCQNKCNENLQLGLDMVKMHMAFDSIGIPQVVDKNDLKLFCRLDDQHNWCLHDCGFKVQFNMNEFICRHHYQEMTYLLPCFGQAIPILKRECGAKRCGPYRDLDNTVTGRAHRCRLLICDIKCTTNVLIRQCANEYGQRAAHLIMNYASQHVSFWMKDLKNGLNRTIGNPMVRIPSLCFKLFCRESDLRRCFL